MMRAVPQPDPTESQGLNEHVDWMTYSHQQLYDMVNNGVDLTGATDVAASWAGLSETLMRMSSTLNTALGASTDGWQGKAADQARNGLAGLVDWTNNTGENAVIVSGCVSRQADALQTARAKMPAPPAQGGQVITPTPVVHTTAFTEAPIAYPGPVVTSKEATESHQQAARVMQQYQASSADVARTIPQFYAPSNPVTGPTPPPVNTPIAPPSSPPTAGPGPMPVGGFGGMASPGGGPAIEGATAGIGGGPRPTPTTSANPSAGAAAEGAAEPTQAAAARSTSTMPGGAMGGMGGQRGNDREHRRRYWQDDDGIFEVDARIMPGVIGEEQRD